MWFLRSFAVTLGASIGLMLGTFLCYGLVAVVLYFLAWGFPWRS